MFWRYFWMKDAKRSKFEVIGRFHVQSIFCAEREFQRSKWSDSNGIKKITSIPFWKCNARKIKRERSWKSHPSKSNLAVCQCWPLPIQNSISGASEVQFMQTQLFWIPYSKIYKRSKFQPKTMSYEGDMIFQRWQLNSTTKQVAWRNESKFHPEASKPTSNLAPLVNILEGQGRQPPTSSQPAASRQPPSHYHHLLMFTLELWFSYLQFVYK